MINQLTTLRGASPNRALPWPKDSLGITLDYFYIPPTEFVIDHEQRALDFGKEIRANMQNQDHRMFWAAYDSPDLEKDWPQYFESEEKYRRLQHIKQLYDPQNLFQNVMSIPLPTQDATSSLKRETTMAATMNTSPVNASDVCSTQSEDGACLADTEALA